jgi:PAC2 family
MLTRRSRYEGPTGMATIVMDAAQRRAMASCNVWGQAPHYLQRATNPAVSRALLTAVARLRWCPVCTGERLCLRNGRYYSSGSVS